MRVEYKTTVCLDGRLRFVALRKTPCCPRMDEARGDYIDLPMEYDSGPPTCTIKTRSYEDYEYMAIDFCPFCGLKIECVEVERVRTVAKKRPLPPQPAREETYYEEVAEPPTSSPAPPPSPGTASGPSSGNPDSGTKPT